MTDKQKQNILAKALSQWIKSDWDSLIEFDNQNLSTNSNRVQLALLASSAYMQKGKIAEAKELLLQAQSWGASQKQIRQTLISGVYNTLGRAQAIQDKEEESLNSFQKAVNILNPTNKTIVQKNARAIFENIQLGLLPKAANLMDKELKKLKSAESNKQAVLTIFQTELDLIKHELSLAQKRHQLYKLPNQKVHLNTEVPSSDTINTEQLKTLSFSQLDQDLWVLEKTNYKKEGFFVEFGATDGVLLSNSYLLEKQFDWKGICADPNPKFYTKLKNNRACILSNACIGEKSGETVNFIFADVYGGMKKHAHEDQHKEKREAYEAKGDSSQLTTISLHDFLIQQNAPKHIDYLSIDTEGSEYDILSTFPFEKWDISLLTIEHNFTPRRKDIRALLERHGYQCTEQQWDDWYEKTTPNTAHMETTR